ncbi:hypothetical protein QYZ87_02805 [Porphyromonadaceae bacterium W3.11]|nr:hypothetical protein [Porphyromonadaceae bacterium W3.11]
MIVYLPEADALSLCPYISPRVRPHSSSVRMAFRVIFTRRERKYRKKDRRAKISWDLGIASNMSHFWESTRM